MMGNRRTIREDERAFTGLEAAIVLTAFVVVAAVFSYVVLNAGFFTTQTAKSTIHTGISHATSSVELAGDVIGYGTGDGATDQLDNVTFYVRLTAGQNSVDLNETVVTYTIETGHYLMRKNFTCCLNGTMPDANGQWAFQFIGGTNDTDYLLERGEKAQIFANIQNLAPNALFTVEVKPPDGSVLAISKAVPASIMRVMSM